MPEIADILNTNTVLKVRLVLYGILIFFSFFIFIGVSIMTEGQVCPLFCKRYCSTVFTCQFPMGVAITFQLIYLLVRMATIVLNTMGKIPAGSPLFRDTSELIYSIVDLVVCGLTFIGAILLTAGMAVTCDNHECSDPVYKDFVYASGAAQAGAWISTLAWLVVGVASFLYLYVTGKICCLPGPRNNTLCSPEDTGPRDNTSPSHEATEPRNNTSSSPEDTGPNNNTASSPEANEMPNTRSDFPLITTTQP